MHISGLATRFQPEKLDSISEVLSGFPWVEIHTVEKETGKMVLVVEGKNVHDETEKLKQLQDIPGVVTVELVYHAFEESEEISPRKDNTEEILSHLNR
jgi:nitrate reductase NapD